MSGNGTHTMKFSLRTILPVLILTGTAYASSGDRSEEFVQCVDTCKPRRCEPHQSNSIPLILQLTRWTCTDDCKYTCMHEITDLAIQNRTPIQQYHGKWPFWRFAGMQEPASVAFSLLNLWAHVRGGSKIRKKVPISHPMRPYLLAWSTVSINSWIWSSVFHTRDLPLTEKLDYFAAALSILYALYGAIIRLFHLYPLPQPNRLTRAGPPTKSPAYTILTIISALIFIGHISYLSLLPRFDYTYNIVFNLVLGMTHNALWATYSLPASLSLIRRFPAQPKTYRPKFVSKAAVFVILTTAATGLELFDFPPWARIIDAHALWHLSTAPIALLWYDFLVEDSLDNSWREQRM